MIVEDHINVLQSANEELPNRGEGFCQTEARGSSKNLMFGFNYIHNSYMDLSKTVQVQQINNSNLTYRTLASNIDFGSR